MGDRVFCFQLNWYIVSGNRLSLEDLWRHPWRSGAVACQWPRMLGTMPGAVSANLCLSAPLCFKTEGKLKRISQGATKLTNYYIYKITKCWQRAFLLFGEVRCNRNLRILIYIACSCLRIPQEPQRFFNGILEITR